MSENKFNIICRVSGTKVKSRIKGYLETNFSEMDQGQTDFKIIVHLDFDPDDIPSEVKLECLPPRGFLEMKTETLKPKTSSGVLEMGIVYGDAPVGYYTVEGKVEHGDYNTEIAKLEGTFFSLRVPEVKIVSCTVKPKTISRGDKFEVKVKLHSPAPQKIKGTISGKLKPSDSASATRVYELEGQKIGAKDERTLTWTLMVPRDEEEIGDYFAEIKFDSRETSSIESFEDVLKLKRQRDIQVISLTAEPGVASPKDKLKINAMLQNTGLSGKVAELVLSITDPGSGTISMEPKKVTLAPGKEHEVMWPWKVPEDAALGFYQLSLQWKFKKTGEEKTVPGGTFEIKDEHLLELQSLSTDRDYYLWGHEVRISMVIGDVGTRSEKQVQTVENRIMTSKGDVLHSEKQRKKVGSEGTEFVFLWQIPEGMESSSLDVETEITYRKKRLFFRKNPRLINVEKPIILRFDIIQPSKADEAKMINKYILEGENVSSREKYHDLRIIRTSSNTSIVVHNKKILNGISWEAVDPVSRNKADELYFSYLILSKGIKLEEFREMKDYWTELGQLWAARLSVGLRELFRSGSTGGDGFFGKPKHYFPLIMSKLDEQRMSELKSRLGSNLHELKQWRDYARKSLIKVKPNVIKKFYDDLDLPEVAPFENTAIGLTLVYLEFNQIKENTKLALLMKAFRNLLNEQVTGSGEISKNSLHRSLNNWLEYFKNPKIEIDEDDEIAWFLDLIYSIAAIKLISSTLNLIDYITTNERLTRIQFINLCFYTAAYNMLNIEYLHNNIRYDRFMEESRNKSELSRHFHNVEVLSEKMEQTIIHTNRLFENHKSNMEIRNKSALLFDSIKMAGKSNILSGLSGEQVHKQLVFKNSSKKQLRFNLLFAFPTEDWHLLEPETNLIDGVYHKENLIIPASGKYKERVTVSFPKSLSYQDYKGLIKLEPVDVRLLEE